MAAAYDRWDGADNGSFRVMLETAWPSVFEKEARLA